MTARKGSRSGLAPGKARVHDDGTISLNLSGVEAGGRRRKRIPEGDYAAVVRKVDPIKFKTGSQGFTMVFELSEGKYKGQPFWENFPLIDSNGQTMSNTLWKIRGTLEAIGVSVPDNAFKLNPKQLVGKPVGLGIVDGEDQDGNVRSEINNIFHVSLLEEEEEDEAEDEADEEDDELEEEEEEEEEEVEDEDEEEEDIDLS